MKRLLPPFRFKALFSAFIAVLLTASAAGAADTALATARALLAQGRAAAAYDAFYQLFQDDPASPDINFYLGQAAYAKGDYEAALMAYERVLIARPEAQRVKLEMARTHMALGNYPDAKALFHEVLAAHPPLAVERNINLMLAAIAAAERKNFFTGAIAVGLNMDDNIEAAPVNDRVKVGLFDLILTGDSATPVRDEILNTTETISHIYKINDTWSWKTTGLNYNDWYMTSRPLDINYFGISSGPVFQRGATTTDLYLYYDKVNLDYDSYMDITGAGSTITYIFNPAVMLNGALRVEKRSYKSLTGKDATNVQAIISPSYAFGANRLVLAGLLERENADEGYNSYDRNQWKVRFERSFPRNVLAYASYARRQSDYDDNDPIFEKTRTDTVEDFIIGATLTPWISRDQQRRVTVDLSETYTESDSNIDLYRYRKHVSAILVSYLF